MKNFILPLTIALLFAFGCSKDEDGLLEGNKSSIYVTVEYEWEYSYDRIFQDNGSKVYLFLNINYRDGYGFYGGKLVKHAVETLASDIQTVSGGQVVFAAVPKGTHTVVAVSKNKGTWKMTAINTNNTNTLSFLFER